MKDRLLAMALTAYEDAICPSCGQPRDRSWNEDMEGFYEAHRVTCQGCLALHLERDGQPVKPAEHLFVRDTSPDGYEPDPRMAPRV